MLPMFVILFAMFYLLMIRPEQQRKKAHEQLLAAIKQNDHVVTIGGVYGVVTNVRREADEITIRIDDTTNTKMRVTFNSTGLTIDAAANNWSGAADVTAASDDLTAALTKLRSQAQAFSTNLSTVQIRQDFTKAMINTLQSGADALTLADSNEEGANLLALQTRQQLSTTALSLASQASQSVLRLFQ